MSNSGPALQEPQPGASQHSAASVVLLHLIWVILMTLLTSLCLSILHCDLATSQDVMRMKDERH